MAALGAAAIAAAASYFSIGRLSSPAVTAGVYVLQGRVVHVADGDTVTLQTADGERRIRLASIDAPEIGHGEVKPGQPYGQAARRGLAGLAAGKILQAKCYEKDQYARDVCDLPGERGHTVNWEMVAAGYAWANTARHGEYLRDPALREVESGARDKKLGLWADANPIAPWEWRYQCWNQRRCNAK